MKTTTIILTRRQAEILKFIVGCWSKGFTPNIREIQERFRIGSQNGVVCHLAALRKKGYLETRPGGRSLRLTPRAMGMAK